MKAQPANLNEISERISESSAFARLDKASFLGILSPSFRKLPSFPTRIGRVQQPVNDGTRAHHSKAVASIAVMIAKELDLSRRASAYSLVWGLLHDVGTWPLSHTGEAGFRRTTNIDASELRAALIKGDYRLPSWLSLHKTLKELHIDAELLLALFDKRETSFEDEVNLLRRLVHSPITPDTLEGMHRSGLAYGVDVPNPQLFASVFVKDLIAGVRLSKEQSHLVLWFWRSKAKIYDRFINEQTAIEFESQWSLWIADTFYKLSLEDTLFLSEKDLIRSVLSKNLPRRCKLVRYKNPLSYQLSAKLHRKRRLKEDVAIDELPRILLKAEKLT